MIDSSRTTMMKIKRRTSLSTTRTRRILLTAALCALLSPATLPLVTSFTPLSFSNTFRTSTKSPNQHLTNSALPTSTSSSTQLNVWWFGGTETSSITNNDSTTSADSCELVAVRIERTSANSRRIAGDIIVPRPIDDVWSILTDYDNLSIHVPNLVESRRVNPKPSTAHHSPGNGSYTCRLFQKGAQKIVGFEFGASVTMDMKERITLLNDNGTMNNGIGNEIDTTEEEEMMIIPQRRSIGFKCVDSQFFSVFDGEWKVTPTIDPEDPTKSATKIEYVVDVRPKGPVPVAALEWRIREDVPSNLRAVKQASIELGRSSGNDDDDDDGVVVEEFTQQRQNNNGGAGATTSTNASTGTNQGGISSRQQLEGRVRSMNDMRRQTTTTTSPNMERESMRSTTVMTASSSSSSSSSSTNPTTTTATKRSKQISKLSPVRVEWYEDETMAAYLRKRRS